MAIDMIIHDSRLAGAPPSIADNIYGVGPWASVGHILAWTAVVADGGGGLRKLMIMCHGYPGGLQLGAEDVTTKTVSLFGKLQGKVKNIVLYACSPAQVSVSTGRSGKMLCAQMAGYSKANVFASDATQFYTGATSIIDFGSWEGTVFWFTPNGHWRAIDSDFSLP